MADFCVPERSSRPAAFHAVVERVMLDVGLLYETQTRMMH